MAADLCATAPAFGEAIARCDAVTARVAGFRVSEVIAAAPESSRLGEIDVVQIALVAVQLALAMEWRARGVEPDGVLGTSLGEITAAAVAGAIAWEDALELAAERGRLLAALKPDGGAVVVNVSEADAAELLRGLEADAGISGLNGPGTTAFSGTHAAMAELLRRSAERGVYAARINVEYPAHSPLLDPLVAPLRERLRGLAPKPSALPFYSTVSGTRMPGEALGADYWASNLRAPVRVAPALASALRDGFEVILECTPHPIFKKPVLDALTLAGSTAIHQATLRRQQCGEDCFAEASAVLRARGVPVIAFEEKLS
jgi:acyl transferase domain-containing protein